MVDFYGAKSVPPHFLNQNEELSKKLAHVYVYTRAYTQIRERGGLLGPTPPLIGLTIQIIGWGQGGILNVWESGNYFPR